MDEEKTLTPINFVKGPEEYYIKARLQKQYGIEPENLKGTLVMKGKEKIYFYQGSLTEKQILEIRDIAPIELVGVYLGKIEHNLDSIRLSIDGALLLKNLIKKNIYDLPEKEVENWMMGRELNIPTDINGFVIIRHREDLLGTGKASKEKISNFIPKERRLKDRNN